MYTNHLTTVSIVKQINLTLFLINKLNLRLIKASQYLSQFRLDVRHKSDKQHVMFNVLFRFMSESARERDMLISKKNTLDEMFVFNEFLIKMSKEFKIRVQVFYVKNKK